MARILPLLNKHSVDVRVGHDSHLEFRCCSDEVALLIANALRLKITLQWVRVYTYKEAAVESDGMIFGFMVHGIRPIRYEDCEIKRARKGASGWRKAKLTYLGELELADHPYPPHSAKKEDLKRMLWSITLQRQKDGKFPTYRFISSF